MTIIVFGQRLQGRSRTFLQIAREWVRVNAGGSATTAGLRALAERVSGARLGRIFNEGACVEGYRELLHALTLDTRAGLHVVPS